MRSFQIEETVQGLNTSGAMKVPESVQLLVPVFEDSPNAIPVTVRFRFRIQEEKLLLTCAIQNPEEIERAEFGQIVATIQSNGEVFLASAPQDAKGI